MRRFSTHQIPPFLREKEEEESFGAFIPMVKWTRKKRGDRQAFGLLSFGALRFGGRTIFGDNIVFFELI